MSASEPATTGPLVISSSQLDTFEDCHRKWWLEKVVRLPQVPKGYLVFGTVLHACLERWASADESGRVTYVATEGSLKGQHIGDPVEVFPAGWERVEGQTVTPNEAALIRKLVEQAVERGLVQRGDGRVLEREVRLPVIDGVELIGFIDVFLPGMEETEGLEILPQIADHKTFGESSQRFLAQPNADSPNYLGKNKQLRTYAAATSLIDGWTGSVEVRHNQFPKWNDGKGPRSVEAILQPEDIAQRWTEIQTAAKKMLGVRLVKKWDDVPGPKEVDTCQKYGGCPFREICGRRTTIEGYRGTVERQLAAAGAPRPNVTLKARKGEKEMSNDIFARARGAKSVQPQPTVPAIGTPASPTQPAAVSSTPVAINGGVAPPAAPISPPINPPPWANPACTACFGMGFNKNGRPCQLCDALAKRLKRPTSSMYLLAGDAQSGFTATARSEKTADLFALSAPESWSSKDGNVQAQAEATGPAAAASPSPAQAVTTSAPAIVAQPVSPTITSVTVNTTTVEVVEASVPKSEEAASKRGRKPAGITILIGCAQLKGPDRPTLTAQELLMRLGVELAKDMGAESYWALDAFKRRDRIKQRSAEIAEGLGRTVLLVAGVRDPDVDSLVSSLLPHAEVVVEGLR